MTSRSAPSYLPAEIPDVMCAVVHACEAAGWPGGIAAAQQAGQTHPAVGVSRIVLHATHDAVLRPLNTIGRSAGFLYGPVPATPEELHEPDVLAGLRRLRERVDPDRRFAAMSRIAT